MVTNYYPYNNIRGSYTANQGRYVRSYPSNQGRYVNNYSNYSDQRGFFFPFVFGGLAGTALGYGIANNNNNNFNNRPPVYYYPPVYYPPYPVQAPYYWN